MSEAPKRRWFRYSLRTLFVVVMVAIAFCLGWVGGRSHLFRQHAADLLTGATEEDDPFAGTIEDAEGRVDKLRKLQEKEHIIEIGPGDGLDPFRSRRPDQGLELIR